MRKTSFHTIVLSLLLGVNLLPAQTKRAAHWFFGYECGIDFNSGAAAADVTGKLISIEGCSLISDNNGNLLFYSNGPEVWNRYGILMPNSNGVIGDESSSQSSLIVPKPGSNSLFYLFNTSTFLQNGGLYYNTVDMNLNGGLGDFSVKNVSLLSPCTEELAATRHCNSTDYWVVARMPLKDTLKLYAYQVSAAGISAPVISKIPTTILLNSQVGTITFSQDGSILSHSNFGSTVIHILNFDKQTGQFSLQLSVNQYPDEYVYSNALSPNGTKLYITSWRVPAQSLAQHRCYLSEFDLLAGNITLSRMNLDSVDLSNGSPNGFGFIGAVRLAPDQKIYVSRWNQNPPLIPNVNWYNTLDSLGVINAPDQTAPMCNYQQNGLYLYQKPTQIGLPNFVSNFTSDQTVVNTCLGADVGLNKNYIDRISVNVSPNPFDEYTYILVLQAERSEYRIELMDVLGNVLMSIYTDSPDGFKVQRGNLPAGIYSLRLFENKTLLTQKKLIAR